MSAFDAACLTSAVSPNGTGKSTLPGIMPGLRAASRRSVRDLRIARSTRSGRERGGAMSAFDARLTAVTGIMPGLRVASHRSVRDLRGIRSTRRGRDRSRAMSAFDAARLTALPGILPEPQPAYRGSLRAVETAEAVR